MHLYRMLIIGVLATALGLAAEAKKSIQISRTPEAPLIDGILDDPAWASAKIATDFYRFEPESGGHAPV